MRKTIPIFPINVRCWVGLSKDAEIKNRIYDDRYSKVYPIVQLYFNSIKKDVCWDKLIIGLHVVYGWMPTIPQFKEVINWAVDKKVIFVNTLKEIIRKKIATEEQFDLLKEFSNNSAVGASKLLHFLSPETFPIWDSRVAKAFYSLDKVWHAQVNKTSNWMNYTKTVNDWAKDPQVMDRCEELRCASAFLKDVSDIRMVELVLFHYTKSNKK